MGKEIPTVLKGQAITAEAWNALVARVNQLSADKFNQFAMTTPRRSLVAPGGGGEGVIYVAGLGISIDGYDPSSGGYPINNVGVRSVRISGSSYEAKGGPLNMANHHFQWRTSSLSGETECYIRTHREKVVVDVNNGLPTYKTIEVVGAD